MPLDPAGRDGAPRHSGLILFQTRRYPSRRMKTVRPPHLSAGVVVVRQAAAGWLFLMLRAYRNWDFPKGLVETGEDPSARRAARSHGRNADRRSAVRLGRPLLRNRSLQPQQGGALLPRTDGQRGRDAAGAARARSARAPRVPLAHVRRGDGPLFRPRAARASLGSQDHRNRLDHIASASCWPSTGLRTSICGGISLYITGVTSRASSVEEMSPPMITQDIGE